MVKCKCGNAEFSARQQVYQSVIVDGNNYWLRNVEEACDDAGRPYGPYVCTACEEEHENLRDFGHGKDTDEWNKAVDEYAEALAEVRLYDANNSTSVEEEMQSMARIIAESRFAGLKAEEIRDLAEEMRRTNNEEEEDQDD